MVGAEVTRRLAEQIGRLPTREELKLFIELVVLPPCSQSPAKKHDEWNEKKSRLEKMVAENDRMIRASWKGHEWVKEIV